MTREQAIDWIEALDRYLAAQRKLRRDDACYARKCVMKRSEKAVVDARVALIEVMVPTVTGEGR